MRGAAMSLTAAASGFVVLLLTAPVIQGENDWRVTYASTEICAVKGSTVKIRCSYTYPSRMDPVTGKFWFTKESNNVYVDLRTDSEYSGRVQNQCENKGCTLTIRDLRESDSAVYFFRFTNQGGKYTGSPGVTLSVTDLQVQVSNLIVYTNFNRAELKCHSSCRLPGRPSFVWYKNGRSIWQQASPQLYTDTYYSTYSYSCAVERSENFRSPSVSGLLGVTYTSAQVCALNGSTVDIGCTYRYPSRYPSRSKSKDTTVSKTFWFTKPEGEPVDLKTDPEYAGRVQYYLDKNNCTLRIRDLRESDSAEYKFRFIINQPDGKYIGSPGVTLSVTEPQLQVRVRTSTEISYSNWTELTCHHKCQLPDHYSYIWYKNGQRVENKKVYFHQHPFNPADSYSCAVAGYEWFPSPPVYAPKLPSVSVSPSGEIMEGSSVTLNCSSDANPAVKYTWYKKNKNPDLSEGPQLVLTSLQSSDSGEYYCTAKNELGRRTSEDIIIINVKYAPKLPSVSVSPSGEIVEGSSVTLSCSSDANPAANFTWYKKNQTLLQGAEGSYHFTSISSEDSGIYYCKSENKYGQINSSSIFIDVQYAPQLPSVSVSPSGEIVEGSSVNLTCSSDANPAAKYTWYKKNEDSPKASGQIFSITDIRAEHSGSYYCVAENRRGRHNSTSHLIVAVFPGKWKSAVKGTIVPVFLAITCLSVFLLIRKKRASKHSSEPEDRRDNKEQSLPNQSVEQHYLHYASVYFYKNQNDPVYSNIRQPDRPSTHGEEEEEEDEVEYTDVRFNSASIPPRTRGQETVEDPPELYSTVIKPAEHNRNL